MTSNAEDFWREKLADWKVSGENISLFCRTNRLNVGCFYKWKKRLVGSTPTNSRLELAAKVPKKARVMPSFVEVSLPSTPMPLVLNKILKITTSYGTVIEVPL